MSQDFYGPYSVDRLLAHVTEDVNVDENQDEISGNAIGFRYRMTILYYGRRSTQVGFS